MAKKMKSAEAVVIGGGVIGVSITYALVSYGIKNVILLEKDALASGASGFSSGLVQMHYTNEWDARLAWASFPVFMRWTEIMGGPAVFAQTGCLYVVAPQYADNLRENVAMLRRIGINTVALDPQGVLELQPLVNVSDIGAAAYEPEAGYAIPADTVEGFRRRAQELGACVQQWTAVTRITTRSQRVAGVETVSDRIEAPVVVVAAGAWTPRLLHDIHVPFPGRAKGLDTAIVCRPPELADPHPTFIDNIQGTYFRSESGTLTVVGIPCQKWDVDPDSISTGFPPEAPADAARILTHRVPALEGATLQRGYRAVDCYSPDRHAILDRVPEIEGLYVATAFSGSGFKIAPAVGTCMAELILQGAARTVDIRAFGLARFTAGKRLEGPYPYATRTDHIEP